MDNWSADSGSGGAGTSGLHLHHHGGLSRCVDLPHLCSPPGTSQRYLHQAVEDNNEDIRQAKKFLHKDFIHRNGECAIIDEKGETQDSDQIKV